MKKLLLAAMLSASLLPSVANNRIPTLYGNLIWDDTFTSDADSRMGVYSFQASADLKMTPLVTSSNFYANGNGIMDGRNYYFFSMYEWDGESVYQLYHYDMDTWRLAERPVDVSLPDFANDFTYDSNSGRYFGINNVSTADANQLCEIGFTPNGKPSRLVLADIPNDSTLYTLAADAAGTLYSITSNGNLVTIDEEGNITYKGSLNLAARDRKLYERIQSAAFDPESGLMYWAAQLWDTKAIDLVTELYSVNVKTLELTKIADFPEKAQIVSLYVVPPAAADGAPAAPANVSKTFAGTSLSGNINFTVPDTTYDGKPLTGDLTYTVADSSKVLATGTTQPGAQVSVPVTLDKDGSVRFEVRVSNGVGEGAPAVFRTYIGHDTPALAKNVQMTIVGGKAHITWDAPDSTLNGGYFNADSLVYDVVRYSTASALKRPVATNLTAKEAEVDLPANRWAKYHFAVVAKNGTKQSEEASSNDMAYGPTKNLPYTQKFTGPTSFNEFTVYDENHDKKEVSYPEYGIYFGYGFWDFSNSRRAAIYHAGEGDTAADDWLLTPQLNFKGGSYYKAEFDAWREVPRFTEDLAVAYGPGYDINGYTVIKSTFNPDTLAYDSLTAQTAPTHYTVYFKPEADLVGAVAFHVTSPSMQGLIYVNNLNIALTTEEEAVTNGISTVSVARSHKNGNVYDLNGRLVRRGGQSLSALPKGIYIIDGKKYVVR